MKRIIALYAALAALAVAFGVGPAAAAHKGTQSTEVRDMSSPSEVRIENKATHLKYITLAGGDVVAVPPTPPDVPNGGTIVKFTDDSERERFDKAVATPSVQAWIEAGELVIHGSSSGPLPAPTSGTPKSETSAPSPEPTPPAVAENTDTQSTHGTSRRRDR